MACLNADMIGFRTPVFEVEVEKGRLRQFARAIGESDPLYLDQAAAQRAGYRAQPVPPTFLFCLEMEREDPYDWFDALGLPLGQVLHGSQAFSYERIACAGDTLRFSGEVVDIYHKKGGQLEFLVHRNYVDFVGGPDDGARVASFDRAVVIQHREAPA